MIKFFTFAVSVLSVRAIPYPVRGLEPGERIIGGTFARAGQFPFAAAIYIQTADGTYFCSGALLANQYVLTAGQCVDGALLFTIQLGSNSLEADDPNRLRLATDTYYLHPDYNPDTLENDIGIIKFRSHITYTDYIRGINLIPDSLLPDSSIVLTFGWGQTSDETAGFSAELKYVFLTTLSNEECRQFFGSQITDNMVCVAGTYNEGTCKGDSGSPLLQYSAGGQAYHVGISSFISGNGCESTDPSGFTRSNVYREWIRNITRV